MEQVTRVLVAHGDESTRNLVHLTLASDAWRVVEAGDAPSAIRAVGAERPDVIVLDAELPGSGWQAFVQALRGQPRTARVPIVLVAAPDAVTGPSAGSEVDVVLAPPVDAWALLDAVLPLRPSASG